MNDKQCDSTQDVQELNATMQKIGDSAGEACRSLQANIRLEDIASAADRMAHELTDLFEKIYGKHGEISNAIQDVLKTIRKSEKIITKFISGPTWTELKQLFPDSQEWLAAMANCDVFTYGLMADVFFVLPDLMPEIKKYRKKNPNANSMKEFLPLHEVERPMDNPRFDGPTTITFSLEDYNWPPDAGFIVCLQEAKGRWEREKDTIDNSRIIIQKDFYWLPTSSASHLLMDILSFGVNIDDLPTRKKAVSHGSNYSVQTSKDKRKVQLKSASAEVTVEISNITKLTGTNKAVKKFLVLSLIKANEQILHDGVLSKDFISFPLHELVDIGFYKTERSARNGFSKAMDALTDMKVQGHVKKSKKSGATITALEVLFTGARIEKNQCIVYFNSRIDWGFLSQFYTTIPGYYFKLSNRGSELLYTISYLARQNTKNIQEKGYFDVSARTLQSALQLPGEGCNDPQRDIKNEIEKSVEELIENHRQSYHNEELYCELLPKGIKESPIKEYLDTGYLRVYISGDFAHRFIEVADKKEQKLEEAQKKRDRIREKAMVANLEKNLSGDSK